MILVSASLGGQRQQKAKIEALRQQVELAEQLATQEGRTVRDANNKRTRRAIATMLHANCWRSKTTPQ